MDAIVWIGAGLTAGVFASAVTRASTVVLIFDSVLGIAGAFVGSWVFAWLAWKAPFAGIAGVIAVALSGAVIALVGTAMVVACLRLIRRTTAHP